MFKKSRTELNSDRHDMELLMEAMDRAIAGQCDDIDTSAFADPARGQKLNELIHAFRRSNNVFVMRLNEAMKLIGDNSYVKDTMDQVHSQSESITAMNLASRHLEDSIGNISDGMAHIRDNTHEMMSVMQESTATMRDSIKVVNESSEKICTINVQVQNFQDKIQKIGEIVDIVKKVSSQSSLLALNASIEAARAGEAGKGFSVVAEQVRLLSSNTSNSAEDIVRYVAELTSDIKELAQFMDETTTKLEQGNEKLRYSLESTEKMSSQMLSIGNKVDNIFSDIDTQSNVTRGFTEQVSRIAQSYEELGHDCLEQGTHEYKCSRYIDNVRSDMVRGFSEVTLQDWMDVYEIDHFILLWRVYNNAVDFEKLKISQLDNPDKCKLGKWLASQTDTKITGSNEFSALRSAHKELHRLATESWKAKDSGNEALALDYFNRAFDTYPKYSDAIKNMKNRLRQLGYRDETPRK